MATKRELGNGVEQASPEKKRKQIRVWVDGWLVEIRIFLLIYCVCHNLRIVDI